MFDLEVREDGEGQQKWQNRLHHMRKEWTDSVNFYSGNN